MKTQYLIICLFCISCAGPKNNYIFPGNRVAFGDSNTRAASTDDRWATQLGVVKNYGADGTTSNEHVEIITSTPIGTRDTVFFMSGYNDMRYYGLGGIASYKENIRTILKYLSPYRVYVGNCLRMTPEGYNQDLVYSSASTYEYHDDSTALAYSNALAEVAVEFPNVVLVDLYSIEPTLDIFYEDLKHLNSAGHREVAKKFEEALAGN